jgi:O-antigen/teichoic acid export membrane protein
MGIVINQSINNTITTYLGFVLGAFNVLFLYTYFLSDEYHGLLAFIISTATIMLPFISLGTHNGIIKFYSSYSNKDEKDSFISVMLIVPLLSVIVLTAIGLTSMDFIKLILPKNEYLNETNIWVIIVAAISFAYFEVFYSLVKIKLISVFGNFLKEIFHRVLISILLIFIYFELINEQEFILSVLSIYILRTFIMMIYALRYNSFVFKMTIPKNSFLIFKYLIIICLAGAVANIVLEIDKFMIAQYLNISKVAYYSVAIYISTLITVPRRSLFQIANPLSAKLLNEKKFNELDVLYKKSSLNLLIVCGFVFLLIVYNLNDIYAFIPENYKEGYYVVLIISFTKIYNAFLGNVDGILFNSIYYAKIVFIGVLITFVTVYLNYLLIPLYGLEGAAISSFIAISFYNTIKIYMVYLKFNLHPLTKNSFKIGMIILLGFIISFYFKLEFSIYLNIFIQTLFVSIIYIFIILNFKISVDINNIYTKFIIILKNLANTNK